MPIQLLTYVQWHPLPITPFAFGLAFVHHAETISISRRGRLDVPQN
jgi:hypothetical protein